MPHNMSTQHRGSNDTGSCDIINIVSLPKESRVREMAECFQRAR